MTFSKDSQASLSSPWFHIFKKDCHEDDHTCIQDHKRNKSAEKMFCKISKKSTNVCISHSDPNKKENDSKPDNNSFPYTLPSFGPPLMSGIWSAKDWVIHCPSGSWPSATCDVAASCVSSGDRQNTDWSSLLRIIWHSWWDKNFSRYSFRRTNRCQHETCPFYFPVVCSLKCDLHSHKTACYSDKSVNTGYWSLCIPYVQDLTLLCW